MFFRTFIVVFFRVWVQLLCVVVQAERIGSQNFFFALTEKLHAIFAAVASNEHFGCTKDGA